MLITDLMPVVYYHGSYTKNIDKLMPFSKAHNTIKKPVVYLTPNIHLSSLYIWNREYKFVTFEEQDDGKVIYTEWFENQLSDFYHGVGGSIYVCLSNPDIYLTHIRGVYNSDIPVTVERELDIPDVYEYIIEQELLGNIIIKRYGELTDGDKLSISNRVTGAIHMQRLLVANKNNSYNENNSHNEEISFYKKHFNKEWDAAKNMSQASVDAMIEQWKESVKNKSV